jgi:hypothetical protein
MALYQAVVNLSHPRKGDPSRETDLIAAGETVDLTDDEAAMYLPPRRAEPLIRPAKDSGSALPVMLPRQLSGVAINPRTGKRIGFPGPPQDARPDPAGSSAVQVMIPEAAEPQAGSETVPLVDAEDILPRNRRAPAKTG